MDDTQPVVVQEQVILSKYEGEPLPENEFERITVVDETVVSHEKIENGEVVGPVQDSELVGAEFGSLINNKEVE